MNRKPMKQKKEMVNRHFWEKCLTSLVVTDVLIAMYHFLLSNQSRLLNNTKYWQEVVKWTLSYVASGNMNWPPLWKEICNIYKAKSLYIIQPYNLTPWTLAPQKQKHSSVRTQAKACLPEHHLYQKKLKSKECPSRWSSERILVFMQHEL